jgi:hypothetical protein
MTMTTFIAAPTTTARATATTTATTTTQNTTGFHSALRGLPS